MGTPQFPDLGKHCTVSDCRLIDFLPFTCDRCNQVYCLEHRSYIKHHCTKPNKQDVTVVICPLCAKSVRLIPDQDPNILWEHHVNTDCDPSNYEKVTKKKKCPTQGCRETLVFSNTIKCRDCEVEHCLKHRFGPDHKCPGPKKLETSFSFMSLLNLSSGTSSKEESKSNSTWSNWTSGLLELASNLSGKNQVEKCPLCDATFSSVTSLVDHAKIVHEGSSIKRNGVKKVSISACPKCSKGFLDPNSLVEHVERDHGGSS
ncbi:unnamed protein product [Lathyrus oleraceus]|uniref:Uncharacterized protein n=1 Tax=Pisum sativum TaxID=3888 RepID=A0A9D4XT83_PEA|nr:zinc finger AN1 and C2H2 domain-containing stress-associated protein 11-like [Pisum sativum]XP_050911181.1 zinc finger AN1 and C2H2 domain-containing stress-associated protein 11-like [Pisum sativum]KAI5427063.1 hypothetical protein KIW84_032479 [Pisum sativum]